MSVRDVGDEKTAHGKMMLLKRDRDDRNLEYLDRDENVHCHGGDEQDRQWYLGLVSFLRERMENSG